MRLHLLLFDIFRICDSNNQFRKLKPEQRFVVIDNLMKLLEIFVIERPFFSKFTRNHKSIHICSEQVTSLPCFLLWYTEFGLPADNPKHVSLNVADISTPSSNERVNLLNLLIVFL
jgi:hypothetical protein